MRKKFLRALFAEVFMRATPLSRDTGTFANRRFVCWTSSTTAVRATARRLKSAVLIACGFTELCFGAFVGQAIAYQEGPAVTDLERRAAAYERILRDWAGLNRYGSENSETPPPAPGENRIVFLGDQITELWGRASAPFFSGRPYFNRGIADQTTAQMLVRFRQDVISLKPRVVVIQGGSNDLTGMFGPGTEGTIEENVRSMTELARVHGIKVVLASVTPVCDCHAAVQTALRPQGKIISLNGWIQEYARESGAVYLDYYSALTSGRDFRMELTVDGVLPNDAGYAMMAPLAEKAIAEALGK